MCDDLSILHGQLLTQRLQRGIILRIQFDPQTRPSIQSHLAALGGRFSQENRGDIRQILARPHGHGKDLENAEVRHGRHHMDRGSAECVRDDLDSSDVRQGRNFSHGRYSSRAMHVGLEDVSGLRLQNLMESVGSEFIFSVGNRNAARAAQLGIGVEFVGQEGFFDPE